MLAKNGSDNVNLFTDIANVPPGLQNHRRGAVKLSNLINLIQSKKGGK